MTNPTKPYNIAERLESVKKIVASGWTQQHYARDEKGIQTFIHDDEATCWCIMGAIYKTANDLRSQARHMCTAEMVGVLREANGWEEGYHIPTWNDEPGRTQEEVIAAIETAIEFVTVPGPSA